jgi:hypothetical protein
LEIQFLQQIAGYAPFIHKRKEDIFRRAQNGFLGKKNYTCPLNGRPQTSETYLKIPPNRKIQLGYPLKICWTT